MFRARAIRGIDDAVVRRGALVTSALLLASLLGATPTITGEPANHAREAIAACRRDDGVLSRYLLCLDLNARRPRALHATYYTELEALDTAMLRDFPRSKRPMRILSSMHHANRWATEYRGGVSLVESLDARRNGTKHVLQADCDLFSFLNVGVAEKVYGAQANPIGIVRMSHDHVVTAAFDGPAIRGLLETVTGEVIALFGGPAERRLRKEYSDLRAMTEDEILAVYLSGIGLALQFDGHDAAALTYFDEALARNDREYVAYVGRSLTLLEMVDRAPTRTKAAALLARAETDAHRALRLEPSADGALLLVGRLRLRQGDALEAESLFARAVDLRPGPYSLYYLGAALQAQRRSDEAVRVLRRARKRVRDPKHPNYRALVAGMNSLLARAHTDLAEANASASDLRRAMTHVAAVGAEFPGNEGIEAPCRSTFEPSVFVNTFPGTGGSAKAVCGMISTQRPSR